jgi:hypothetical protein
MDPNFHVRHSVYYDWAATCRLEFLAKHGLTNELIQSLHFGPILFREECIFRREIRFGDPVSIDIELLGSRHDYSRWTFRHTIRKDPETVSAILTVDGAWLDTVKRKLAAPPPEIVHVFETMPVSKDFQWAD